MKNAELRLKVQGIDCPGCATDMETVLRDMDGVFRVTANYGEETLVIEYDRDLSGADRIASVIRGMGFKVKRF